MDMDIFIPDRIIDRWHYLVNIVWESVLQKILGDIVQWLPIISREKLITKNDTHTRPVIN